MTFRVEEGEGEGEALEVLEEEPINPSIGEKADPPTMRSTETGMPAKGQTPAQDLGDLMRRKFGSSIKRRWDMWRRIRIETLQDISLENMKIGREQEVPVQEEKGLAEGTEARRGREAEEIIMRVEETIGETTVRAQAEEITVQRGKAEEIIVQGTGRRRVDPGVEKTTHLRRAEGTAMRGKEAGEIIIKRVEETTEETTARALAEETIAQIGRAGEIIAQDIGKRRADPGVGETTHLKRAEGTLVKKDEGVAQGPLVMEGP